MSSIPFSNFTKGELSPELHARIDTAQYGAGAKRVRNFIIQRYGGLAFRPGFRFVGEVDNINLKVRYIPFQFNIVQAYVIALENNNLRLLAEGGFVIEDNAQITAITRELQPTITSPFHGYSVGDRIYFSGIVGMTELNGRSAIITAVPSDSTYRININTTNYAAFISSDGIVRADPPAPPPTPPTPPPEPPPAPVTPPVTESGGTGSTGGGGSVGEILETRSGYVVSY